MAEVETNAHAPLPPGTPAPSFSLPVTPDRKVSLEDYRGSPVVLVFYPADFSPVCSDEIAIFNELLPELRQYGAQVFGISVDSVWSHLAWAREKHLRIPLLADFHPKGEVSRKYSAYEEEAGTSRRALFVIDDEGKVFWSYLSPIDVNPGADGVLDALERWSAQKSVSGPSAQQEAGP